MTADDELWAALMADVADETAAKTVSEPSPATVASESSVIAAVEPQVFFPAVPVVSATQIETEVEPAVDIVPSVEDLYDEEEIEQTFSASLFKEPQTNQILIPEVPDALAADIVTESGEILKTGAIDLPILPTTTGSIPIISIAPEEENDDAINLGMGVETTAGIPPIRAASVMNSKANIGVLPIRNRRSDAQNVILAVTSVLLITIGAALIAAHMFNLL